MGELTSGRKVKIDNMANCKRCNGLMVLDILAHSGQHGLKCTMCGRTNDEEWEKYRDERRKISVNSDSSRIYPKRWAKDTSSLDGRAIVEFITERSNFNEE